MTRTLLVFLVITSQTAIGQDVLFGVLAEKTISNTEFGALIMFESKKAVGVGVFYQCDRFDVERDLQNAFYGGLVQVPLVNGRKIVFSGVLRAGISNKDFFFVTPSLETKINIRQRWALVAGMGMRQGYPALSGKLLHKLF